MSKYVEIANKLTEKLNNELDGTFKVHIEDIIKTNDIRYKAIIIQKEGDTLCPTYYPNWEADNDSDYIVNELFSMYLQNQTYILDFDYKRLIDWEYASQYLSLRLVNKEQNNQLISKGIGKDCTDDLYLLVYLEFKNLGCDNASILVNKELSMIWPVDTELIFQKAKENLSNEEYILRSIDDICKEVNLIFGDSF